VDAALAVALGFLDVDDVDVDVCAAVFFFFRDGSGISQH
jgi:hypothetical protein